MENREYGLDIARIVSMFGILMLHILGRGGLLISNEPTSAKYWMYWAIEIIAYSSVDIFAMLTGWLDTNKKSKASVFRVIELIAITVFYSIIITGVFMVFSPEKVVGLKSIIKGIFPMLVGRYWYITCYIPVAILKPYLSVALAGLSIEKHKKLCIILVGVFSIIPTFTSIDFFVEKWGYSTIWLIVCYILGSYLKKIKDTIKISSYKLGGGYIALVLLMVVIKAAYWSLTGKNVPGIIDYTSPFILANAVFALLIFSRIRIGKGKKILLMVSGAAFDVYIIHCHLFVFDYIINGNFEWIDRFSIIAILFVLFGIAVICYCFLSFLGIMRGYFFNKMRIEKIFRTIACKIDKIIY